MSTPSSVLFIPKWFPGREDPQSGVFTLKHAEAIAKHYPIKVMHLCKSAAQSRAFEFETEELDNITILHCHYKTYGEGWRRPFTLWLYVRAFFKSYKKLYPDSKPILTHAHVFTRTVVLAYFLKRWKGIPYIVSEHWTLYQKGGFEKYSPLHRRVMRFVARRSDAIAAVSEVLLREMKIRGLVSKRMRVIENAVAAPATLPTSRKNIIGVVADFDDKNKRISDIINAFAQIAPAHPDWQLHIVGGGTDEDAIHALANQWHTRLSAEGLTDPQIVFHGRQNNAYVYRFMADIAFLVSFSMYETFCVVLIEAILHGKPVISSRSGGPESFITPDNGLLIPRGDTAALQHAIAQMISAHASYTPEQVVASVGGKFSPAAIERKFLELYGEVLG